MNRKVTNVVTTGIDIVHHLAAFCAFKIKSKQTKSFLNGFLFCRAAAISFSRHEKRWNGRLSSEVRKFEDVPIHGGGTASRAGPGWARLGPLLPTGYCTVLTQVPPERCPARPRHAPPCPGDLGVSAVQAGRAWKGQQILSHFIINCFIASPGCTVSPLPHQS